MNVLSQYGCGTSGKVVRSAFIDNSDHDLSGPDINNIIQTAIDNKQVAEPTDPSSAYMLFLDNMTAVDDAAVGLIMSVYTCASLPVIVHLDSMNLS